jgi:hypothetical protein
MRASRQTATATIPVASERDRRGRVNWLAVARRAWLVAALLLAANFIASIPPYYSALRTLCKPPLSFLNNCMTWQLLPSNIGALEHLHISLDTYALYTLLVNVITSLCFWAAGCLIFWRKSKEWLGLSVSLVLILLGASGVTDSLQGDFLSNDSPLILTIPVLIFNIVQWPALGLFLITFPTGRFMPRWSWLIVLLWIIQFGYFWLTTFLPAFEIGLPVIVLLTYGSTLGIQIYRYIWRYSVAQRQQVKWFLFVVLAGLVISVIYNGLSSLVAPLNAPDSWFKLLDGTFTALFFLSVPLGIGISIFRYRLWDIDIIINRALVYGTLTVSLGLVYAGLIIGLQALSGGIIKQNNDVAIVISTLIIATLFHPLRRRIQAIIDRRFYRSKYDAARTLAAFSARLRGEVDLAQLREQLLDVVVETMQPAHVSLWLRVDAQRNKPTRDIP